MESIKTIARMIYEGHFYDVIPEELEPIDVKELKQYFEKEYMIEIESRLADIEESLENTRDLLEIF